MLQLQFLSSHDSRSHSDTQVAGPRGELQLLRWRRRCLHPLRIDPGGFSPCPPSLSIYGPLQFFHPSPNSTFFPLLLCMLSDLVGPPIPRRSSLSLSLPFGQSLMIDPQPKDLWP